MYFHLNSGYTIPALGLGTLAASACAVECAVLSALDAGYRHIDCAAIYENESEVGVALSKRLGKGIDRSSLFVTSKLWCTKHHASSVRLACEESLKKLGLEYLDLYLIHWPVSIKSFEKLSLDDPSVYTFENIDLEETWRAMEELIYAGLAKSIGLSNFNKTQIERILKICKIKPAMLQIESSVNFLNTKLIEYARSHEITITAYAPLGSPGFITAGDIPSLLDEYYIKEIALAHNKTPAQILLRHALQRNICVIPKSVNPTRIQSNFQVFDFELSKDEMDTLNSKGRNIRLFKFLAFKPHPEYPFNDDY